MVFGAGDDWPDDDIETLKALWAGGLSCAAIGQPMGRSKNAVVGKAHRLGLPGRPSPIRASAGGAAPKPKAKPVGKAPTLPPAVAPRVVVPVVASREAVVQRHVMPVATSRDAVGVPAAGLSRRSCQWIHGEPAGAATRFCGAPAMAGCSWCAEHRRQVFTTRLPEWAAA